jgi:hypothetical protein
VLAALCRIEVPDYGAVSKVPLLYRKHELARAGELSGNARPGLAKADRTSHPSDSALEKQRLAGYNLPLEADLVDTRKEGELAVVLGQ